MHLDVRWVAAVLLFLALAPRFAISAVSQASDLCAVSADPCVVTADVTVNPNTTLDFGGRALDLGPGASLSFTSGTLTIRAGSLRVEAAASILGSAPSTSFPTLSIVTTGDIRVEASGTTKGKIDLSGGPQGGLIELTPLGARQVDGLLLATATQAPGFGGATGSVSVGGTITGDAGGSSTEGGGAGADIEITAVAGTLTVAAGISADSGVPDGDGGEVDLTAGTDILQAAAISAAGRGVDATGGDVEPSAGRNLTLGTIDVSGGTGGGGTIFADAGGHALLQGQLNGDGGGEFLFVAATISVTNKVHADAYNDFLGGLVILRACDVAVNVGAVVSSLGPTGENLLQASGQMTIGGT